MLQFDLHGTKDTIIHSMYPHMSAIAMTDGLFGPPVPGRRKT